MILQLQSHSIVLVGSMEVIQDNELNTKAYFLGSAIDGLDVGNDSFCRICANMFSRNAKTKPESMGQLSYRHHDGTSVLREVAKNGFLLCNLILHRLERSCRDIHSLARETGPYFHYFFTPENDAANAGNLWRTELKLCYFDRLGQLSRVNGQAHSQWKLKPLGKQITPSLPLGLHHFTDTIRTKFRHRLTHY